MAKFFFLIQKLAMISCQCRIIIVLLAVCTCYRCARTLPKESVSGGITGASARENICEFSYRKPLSRSPTIILSRLFFRPPNYLRPPVFSVLVFFVLFPRELYASRKFSRRKIQERRDEYPWFFLLLRFDKYFNFNVRFFDYLKMKLRTMNR